MAECTVRLIPTHQIETALYELFQAQAENLSRVIESYDSDSPYLEREVVDAIHRYSFKDDPKSNIDYWEIISELSAINLSKYQAGNMSWMRCQKPTCISSNSANKKIRI